MIHFNRKPKDPNDLLKNPFAFKKGSDQFHYAILNRGWGGCYPLKDQLEQCAKGYFKLIEEVDGTEDYYLTSEEWLRRVQKALMSPKIMNVIYKMFPLLFKASGQLMTLFYGCLIFQSWNWQFRQPDPPTRLLR